MKKLVFALCMVFGAVAVNAQDSTSTTSPTDPSSTSSTSTQSDASVSMEEQGRVKIKSQELPDAVKSSLEGQEYRGWLVASAYKVDASANSATGTSSSSSESSTTGTESSSTSTTETGSATGTSGDTTGVSGDASGAGAYAQEVYIVELKNGAQTKTVRFDKDGKKLDDAGEMNEDQK